LPHAARGSTHRSEIGHEATNRSEAHSEPTSIGDFVFARSIGSDSHNKKSYDILEAKSIYDHTGNFMKVLSERLSEQAGDANTDASAWLEYALYAGW
jgi:hypothetical protein